MKTTEVGLRRLGDEKGEWVIWVRLLDLLAKSKQCLCVWSAAVSY